MADHSQSAVFKIHRHIFLVLFLMAALTFPPLLHAFPSHSTESASEKMSGVERGAIHPHGTAHETSLEGSEWIMRVSSTPLHTAAAVSPNHSAENESFEKASQRSWVPGALFFVLGLLAGISIGYIFSRLRLKMHPQSGEKPEAIPLSDEGRKGVQAKEVILQKPQDDEVVCAVDPQLIQTHKLAAFGQLSTGVAHEINNPLAIINEEAGWLQDLLNQEENKDFRRLGEFRESLDIIIQQTRRCANITHKLLSFAQNMEADVRSLDINEILDEVVGMMEKDAFYLGITIEKAYDQTVSKFLSDPAHLRQMFVNIIKNAFDAVEGGGRVIICTEKVGEDKVSIKVTDTGCGIPSHHLDKVFDPFFTTKPPGKGTGLGLSICYGIATMLGGSITVESTVNQGTTFTVTLPTTPPDSLKERTGDLD